MHGIDWGLAMSKSSTGAKVIAAALLCGSVTLGALGVGAGTAHASEGPFTWCPGQSMADPIGPNNYSTQYGWDMNQCHTWYRVQYGYGNVLRVDTEFPTLQNSTVWDGENPPPDSNFNCGLFWCPVPPHEDPNFNG